MYRRHPTVCIVTSENMGEYAGIQRYVYDLTNFATAHGYKISLVSSKDTGSLVVTRFFDSIGLNYDDLEKDRQGTKLLDNPFKSFFLFLSTTFALIRTCKYRKVSIIHAQDVFFSGFSGVIACKLLKIPLIVHVHGPSPYFFGLDSEASKIQKIAMRALAKVVLYGSDLVLPTDVHTKSLLFPFSSRSNYLCMPIPVQTKLFESACKKPIVSELKNQIVVGFVGRLCKQKNLQVLLNSFASLPSSSRTKVSLVIVGDGPERDLLEREALRLGLKDKIFFAGRVSEEEKIKYLKSFDVFILPSIYEGCPISLLEAMASGKAVITSDIPSIKQVVNNNEAVLVDPYDSEKLRDAMLEVFDNPQLISVLSKRAFEKAQFYDVETVFSQLMDLYDVCGKQHKCDCVGRFEEINNSFWPYNGSSATTLK